MKEKTRLAIIKTAHTIVWAFFASCVVALPWQAWRGHFDIVIVLFVLVSLEIGVLSVNAWRCPISAFAARYTKDRHTNFDVYLPEWLAARTKIIFGPTFLAVLFSMDTYGHRLGIDRLICVSHDVIQIYG